MPQIAPSITDTLLVLVVRATSAKLAVTCVECTALRAVEGADAHYLSQYCFSVSIHKKKPSSLDVERGKSQADFS